MSSPFISTEKRLLDFDWTFAQLKKQYWGGWYTEPQLREAFDHSVCFGLYLADSETGRKQIGFARVVTDYASFSSIMDVFVEESLRGRGYGRQLIESVLRSPAVVRSISILASRDAPEFYRKHGFRPIQCLKIDPQLR